MSSFAVDRQYYLAKASGKPQGGTMMPGSGSRPYNSLFYPARSAMSIGLKSFELTKRSWDDYGLLPVLPVLICSFRPKSGYSRSDYSKACIIRALWPMLDVGKHSAASGSIIEGPTGGQIASLPNRSRPSACIGPQGARPMMAESLSREISDPPCNWTVLLLNYGTWLRSGMTC